MTTSFLPGLPGLYLFSVLALLFKPDVVLSQQMHIDKTEISGGKIIIHYSIVDTLDDKFYTIRLYSSQDNFMHPLKDISGDAGIGMRPGMNKKIAWNPTELGENFDGKISLEVRASLYLPFVHFEGFEKYRHIKRLKPYTLTWSGGTAQNVLNFDLYRKEEKVTAFPNIANVGHYTLILPRHIKPGNHYKLRVSDSKNKDEVVFTEEFRVKRKFPLVLKVVSVAIVAGGLSMLSTFLGEGGGEQPADLPSPLPSPLPSLLPSPILPE